MEVMYFHRISNLIADYAAFIAGRGVLDGASSHSAIPPRPCSSDPVPCHHWPGSADWLFSARCMPPLPAVALARSSSDDRPFLVACQIDLAYWMQRCAKTPSRGFAKPPWSCVRSSVTPFHWSCSRTRLSSEAAPNRVLTFTVAV